MAAERYYSGFIQPSRVKLIESKCMKRGMKQGVNFKMSMEPTPFARADELVVSVMQITAGIKPNWDDMIYWKE